MRIVYKIMFSRIQIWQSPKRKVLRTDIYLKQYSYDMFNNKGKILTILKNPKGIESLPQTLSL